MRLSVFKTLQFLLVMVVNFLTHAQEKLNVLWIITDEHNFRTLGCYRDQLPPEQAFQWGPQAFAETPHIDSLAKNGVIFNRMYGSAPVCTASRASMFTGYYPVTLGIPNNSQRKGDGKYLKANVTTIADILSDEGYMTGYSGKWHLAEERSTADKKDTEQWWSPFPVEDPTDTYGFQDKTYMFNGGHDKWKGMMHDGTPYKSVAKWPKHIGEDKYGQPLYKDDNSENVKFTTDWLADRTIEFIHEHKEKPFFYVVSIPDPHSPDIVRAPYNEMYTNREIILPETYHVAQSRKDDEDTPWWQKPDGKANDPERLKADIQQYLGMVKCIDDNVGRIIQKLKDEGVFENTIIMFSSDHGDLLGEHARLNKGTVHEGSDKIPFILAHGSKNKKPLIPRGKVVNQACNTTDWMPTFLSLLNIESPEIPGRDLTPLLDGKAPKDWNDVTFVRLAFYAAITERYKLHVSYKGEPWLLDIKEDPSEIKNFITNDKYQDVVKGLALELKRYMKISGDHNGKISSILDELLN